MFLHGAPEPPAISIHALREEGDEVAFDTDHEGVIFLSTPSARRATTHPAASRYR